MQLDEFKNELNNVNVRDIEKLKAKVDSHDNIIIIGNGGSSSIASHIFQKYRKLC